MSTKTRTASKPPKPPRVTLTLFTTDDPVAAWKHFRAEATALDPATLSVCKADPDLVRVNVARGADAVRPFADRVRVVLPHANLARALEAPALALALTHAIDRVGITPSTDASDDDSLPVRTSKMFADRQLLTFQLKVFVGLGAYSQSSLNAILEGTGPIDGARDVLTAITALRDDPKLAGAHPFTAAWFDRAGARARRLLGELSPKDAIADEAARDPAAIERDAFWALLGKAHGELRTIGMVLFGEAELDAKVPPLMARTVTREPKTHGAAKGTNGSPVVVTPK